MYWLAMCKLFSKSAIQDSAFYCLKKSIKQKEPDFIGIINEWFVVCNTAGQSFAWCNEQLMILYDLLKQANPKDPKVWAIFLQGSVYLNDKQITNVYEILNDKLENSIHFVSSESASWYTKARFYQEMSLSKERIIQYLEKAVSLDREIANGDALKELSNLKTSLPKKKNIENKSTRDNNMFPTINIPDQMDATPMRGLQMW